MKFLWLILFIVNIGLLPTTIFADINYGLTGNENLQNARADVIGSNGENDSGLENRVLGKIELINNKYRVNNETGPEAYFQISARYLLNNGSYSIFLRCNCIKIVNDPYANKPVPAIIWGERSQIGKRGSFKSTEESILDFTESCYEGFLSDYLKSKKQ